ncbi:DNA helicase [Komagataella phaffii CBS 7435]|uniref:DNA 3'-5' helicase n=2 Tax=Komagataella phaffii TaxID=460519 RepID=C4R3W4_KOMPG|nr:DNA helicase and DNA-dependent ATPase [Komagataella phaffii GS115]AOA63214.1 GQ67_03263T0 [Komagataella phaffii]CAH2450009.1 DNA helicase [Komagataella phaffii CBS 7435]AOA68569.1 GQ68_03232T0 [Komagataella phaffii GS115]CAY70223.1 DNA helicase and DNA-dependent ATPase [Komagataella phaffii GS115]CCA39954.1 DNA helicase [Komagataella phaffii CBS 7435]
MLASLNSQQYEAVTADIHKPLQIIAGPGTGKTKVLTSRVAYLLIEHKIPPSNIIVTTFTKKAANEMVERLQVLFAKENLDPDKYLKGLLIGTFHSICVKLLRRYGTQIGLTPKFKIADERDSNTILSKILTTLSDDVVRLKFHPSSVSVDIYQKDPKETDKLHGYDLKKAKSQISKLKSLTTTPQTYSTTSARSFDLAVIYSLYQESLRKHNLIDFDDCLLYTYLLLSETRKKGRVLLKELKHVLVDEFQDTNKIQMELLYLLGQCTDDQNFEDNVTVVGDSDQSIYMFRNAVASNFENMIIHYQNCQEITLKENYRSTSNILNFSEQIMTQQKDRKQKSLRSQISHLNIPIVYVRTQNTFKEADHIASEVAKLGLMSGLLTSYNDIAILLRSSFQSRVIEQSLVTNRIPYEVVHGRAFWELKEIRVAMDYLRAIVNNSDNLAILRTLNFPPRGVGNKTLQRLEELIDKSDCPVIETLEMAIHDKKNGFLNVKSESGVRQYIDILKECGRLLDSTSLDCEASLEACFDQIVQLANLKEIKKTPETSKGTHDSENALKAVEENLNEFKRQLIEYKPIIDQIITAEAGDTPLTTRDVLSSFLDSIDLYETSNNENKKDSKKGRVTISTIHGAKGLEWPVVFIPGCTDGVIPSKWTLEDDGPDSSTNLDEDRRCFYVALTRAKSMLYLSSYKERSTPWSGEESNEVSCFLKPTLKMFQNQLVTSISNMSKNSWRDLYEAMGKEYKPVSNILTESNRSRNHIVSTKDFLKNKQFKSPLLTKSTTAPSYVPDRSNNKKRRLGVRRRI